VNVCYLLESSDRSHCSVVSDDLSPLYAARSQFDSMLDVLADTALIRVTFAGQVIHSIVSSEPMEVAWWCSG